MSLLWIPITLLAAAAQTARNATQSGLVSAIGTVGATQVRFLYGLPFAVIFLAVLAAISAEAIPPINRYVFAFACLGAVAQILATGLMLAAMKEKSFAVATALIKTEPVIVAIFGFIVLGDALTPMKALAIVIATTGVLYLSSTPDGKLTMFGGGRALWLGLVAGAGFGMAAVGFRGAILAFPSGSFYMRATTVLVFALTIQVVLLAIYMLVFDRPALTKSLRTWRLSLAAGFLGAFASQCWFLGFSLTSAANVRTLALVEVIMAQIVSRRLFSQEISARELAGMGLIVAGVALLLYAAAT